MKSLEVASLLFDRGPEEAANAIAKAIASGAYEPGTVVTREAFNFLMISLICRKQTGALTLPMIEKAGEKLQSAEVGVGSIVVYRMLLFDLASNIGVSLKMPGDVTASGSQLDWELLQAFAPATASFARRAREIQELYARSKR